MAEVHAFRALRYTKKAQPELVIAPPFDVISAAEQQALYALSAANVVRVEYGEQRASDSPADSRYTRAAGHLARWQAEGILAQDDRPAIYAYQQRFSVGGRSHVRHAWFTALRLEEWSAGVVKPHERTLANPKADRLQLLRTTRTQVSPVYSLFRPRQSGPVAMPEGEPLMDFEADGHRHTLSAIREKPEIAAFQRLLVSADVYIADGHHRYETALAYRDEVRARAAGWSGEEPENFVLMALTSYDDPGLVVLPTHRLVHRPAPADVAERLQKHFAANEIPGDVESALAALGAADAGSFVALGLLGERSHLLTVRDRAAIEALMPQEQSAAWKRLDVNLLQYGVLLDVFGIDDAALTAGDAVSYTQDADDAASALASGAATCAFLLQATPVEQVLDVADAGERMPQKSTFFYPKLPTGLVMRVLN
jgi:uncharacterized protein (DUF1015 family)